MRSVNWSIALGLLILFIGGIDLVCWRAEYVQHVQDCCSFVDVASRIADAWAPRVLLGLHGRMQRARALRYRRSYGLGLGSWRG